MFEDINEAINYIDSITGSAFIAERPLTSAEYQKIQEATTYINLKS